jgi:hypothetical protein
VIGERLGVNAGGDLRCPTTTEDGSQLYTTARGSKVNQSSTANPNTPDCLATLPYQCMPW